MILQTDSEKPHQQILGSKDKQPIFELITRYETAGSEREQTQEALKGRSAGQGGDSAPSYFLRIYSSAIINALRSVVHYYPSQDLSGSTIEIKWPYPILVHHYDVLHEFKAKCDTKDLNDLCVREKDASAHLTHLLGFMDDNIMPRVRAEQQRVQEGFHTFENQWIVFKPGKTVVMKDTAGKWRAMVVHSVTGGIYQNSTAPWEVLGWHLGYDGKFLGRVTYRMNLATFDGLQSFGGDTIYVSESEDFEVKELKDLISYGKMYYSLLRRQCRYYKGKVVLHPYNEVR